MGGGVVMFHMKHSGRGEEIGKMELSAPFRYNTRF